jgi:hypothetical protein
MPPRFPHMLGSLKCTCPPPSSGMRNLCTDRALLRSFLPLLDTAEYSILAALPMAWAAVDPLFCCLTTSSSSSVLVASISACVFSSLCSSRYLSMYPTDFSAYSSRSKFSSCFICTFFLALIYRLKPRSSVILVCNGLLMARRPVYLKWNFILGVQFLPSKRDNLLYYTLKRSQVIKDGTLCF